MRASRMVSLATGVIASVILTTAGCAGDDVTQPAAPRASAALGTAEQGPLVWTRIASSPSSLSLAVADTARLSATGTMKYRAGRYPTGVSWLSRSPAVATVDATTGLISAAGAGTAWVIVTADGLRDSTKVTVAALVPPPPPVDTTVTPPPADTVVSTPSTPTAPVAGAFYVAPNGSDAAAGTQSAPWRTLKASLPRLRAGQTLYVRGGTYAETVTGISIQPGTPTARIRVAAYPGERPVLVGFLWLTRPSYWTLDGLNVTWADGSSSKNHMIKMTNGIGWVFENAEVWGAHSFAGLLVAGTATGEPRDWTVRNNCIHDTYPSNDTNQDHNIYANPGVTSTGGLIERNLLFNAPNGEGVKVAGPSTTSGGSGGVTIRNNTIYNSGQNILVGGQTSNTVIERNIFMKVGSNYANVRGYKISGSGNVARNNLGAAARSLLLNDSGFPPVADGGGNVFPIDPQFDAISCSGFRPRNAAAQGYGRYAGQ